MPRKKKWSGRLHLPTHRYKRVKLEPSSSSCSSSEQESSDCRSPGGVRGTTTVREQPSDTTKTQEQEASDPCHAAPQTGLPPEQSQQQQPQPPQPQPQPQPQPATYDQYEAADEPSRLEDPSPPAPSAEGSFVPGSSSKMSLSQQTPKQTPRQKARTPRPAISVDGSPYMTLKRTQWCSSFPAGGRPNCHHTATPGWATQAVLWQLRISARVFCGWCTLAWVVSSCP